MRRYILTGTPGSGKTTLLRALEQQGYAVVEEAATDVIALEQARGNLEPWKSCQFIEEVLRLQKQRLLLTATLTSPIQFCDRSPVCTLALSRYLRCRPPRSLMDEIERIRREGIFERQVFFVESMGACAPTKARTISVQEASVFEEIHREVYQSEGYECIAVPPGTVSERLQMIVAEVAKVTSSVA